MPAWTTLRKPISGGWSGTRQTVKVMSELARRGAGHPLVIKAAQDAVRGVPERNDFESVRAVIRDVRSRMRYTRDPLGTELVKAPWVVIHNTQLGQAEPMDCDDASVLAASMLQALGIPSGFRVVAADRNRPGQASHVYVVAQDSQTGDLIAADPIMRKWDVGREVPVKDWTKAPETSMLGSPSTKLAARVGMETLKAYALPIAAVSLLIIGLIARKRGS